LDSYCWVGFGPARAYAFNLRQLSFGTAQWRQTGDLVTGPLAPHPIEEWSWCDAVAWVLEDMDVWL
jgi:hypothetical protein